MAKRGKTKLMDTGVFVALLRGINVGGKNKLPSKELVKVFEGAGCTRVRTYIQSGNVVFEARAQVASGIALDVSAAIEREFGYTVPVVTRTAAEMAAVVQENPFVERGGAPEVDPKHLHVAFLSAKPTAAQVRKLDPERSPGDSFVVSGREVFLHCPNGMARTKLTNAYLDSRLETVSTVRNEKTVRTLAEWSGAEEK